MKREVYLIIFLSLIAGLLCVVLYNTVSIGNRLEELPASNSGKDEMEKFYFQSSIYQSIENDGTDIREALVGYDMPADSAKPMLVCRFTSLSCDICVHFALNKIIEHFGSAENPHVVLIASGALPESLKDLQGMIHIGNNMLELSTEKSNMPFLFILEDGKVKHSFVPDKNFPEYTDIYLKKIKKKYFAS